MHDAFVGRQPIFDENMNVYAYELLFRNEQRLDALVVDGNEASTQVMLNTFTEFGLDSIVGKHLAFINLTEDLITNEILQLLPCDRVVLEILEDVLVNEVIIDAIRQLSAQGYLIALDDFVYDQSWQPLVEIADIIKLDVLNIAECEIKKQVDFLRPYKARLLAEKIETIEQFDFLKSLGFDYYQGYFLSKPTVVEGKRTPTNKLSILQLLAKLTQPSPVHSEVEKLITQDVNLSYKILRFINASCFALPRKIVSINEAVLYLGLDNIRRFSSMLAMSGFSDQPHEVLLAALVRGRMCELLAAEVSYDDTETYFTLGLLSTLDVMLSMSIEQVVAELPLEEELNQALLNGVGAMGAALSCTLAYEQQRWESVSFADLSEVTITNIYFRAVQWSNETGVTLRSD